MNNGQDDVNKVFKEKSECRHTARQQDNSQGFVVCQSQSEPGNLYTDHDTLLLYPLSVVSSPSYTPHSCLLSPDWHFGPSNFIGEWTIFNCDHRKKVSVMDV